MERRRIGRDGAEQLGSIGVLGGLSIGQRRMLAGLVDEASAQAGETLMPRASPAMR